MNNWYPEKQVENMNRFLDEEMNSLMLESTDKRVKEYNDVSSGTIKATLPISEATKDPRKHIGGQELSKLIKKYMVDNADYEG